MRKRKPRGWRLDNADLTLKVADLEKRILKLEQRVRKVGRIQGPSDNLEAAPSNREGTVKGKKMEDKGE